MRLAPTFPLAVFLLAVFLLAPWGRAWAFQEDIDALRKAAGPALLCPEQGQVHSFSSDWPDGRPLAASGDPVAFVRDGDSVLKVSINPANAAEMLVDRLAVVVVAYKHPERMVALERGSDLVGVARLYAISFDRQEVSSSWALAFEGTQSGAIWWRCREVSPRELLP
jgi:hypothetical protein